MQYRAALTIPAGTSEADPAILTLPVSYGRLKSYELYFPAGQAGLTYVQVWYLGRQILPTSPGGSYRGDDLQVRQSDNYPVYSPPFELEIRGWAPLASYDHTVYLLFYLELPVMVVQSQAGVQAVEVPTFEEE